MSDLVKRLRHGEYVESMMNGEPTKTIEGEAAAEIERLQAENAKLKKYWFDDADPQETSFKDEFLNYRHRLLPEGA